MREITKDRKIAYVIATLALAVSLSLMFLPASEYNFIWCGIGFAALSAFTYALIKKRSIRSYNSRWVLIILAAFAALFLTLYYLSGLKFGFAISSKGVISLGSVFKRIIPLTAIILFSELLRSVLLAESSKIVTFISYVICVASEVVCAGGIPSFRSAYQLIDFLGMILFPALTANLLYNYISKRYGILPNTVYRLIIGLYVYLIPFVPDTPRIFTAFLLLILPLGIRLFIAALFEKKVRIAKKRESKLRFIPSAIAVIAMALFIMLISCQFRFGILVIATESMTGEINKGDAVIYEAYEHCDKIQENDIIVFEEGDRQVVHRVVRIETVNGQRQYTTQGDANEGVDPGYRTDGQIVGVVRMKVLYIGYPSLWLREIFNN